MATVPDPAYSAVVEHYSSRLSDPVERLRFLRLCGQIPERAPRVLTSGPMAQWAYRFLLLDTLSSTTEFPIGPIRRRDRFLLWCYRRFGKTLRYSRVAAAAAGLVLLIAAGVATNQSPTPKAAALGSLEPAPDQVQTAPILTPALRREPSLEVWLVEAKGLEELYSNGLQVLNNYVTHTGPRSYPVYKIGADGAREDPEWRDRPIGIVFHTTVSEIAPPLEPANNQEIRYRGKRLLKYIAREQLYNFVIDRFGRVYRIIPAAEYSYHAGYSIWGESGEYYLNLNQSFIGVAFETRPEAVEPGVPPEVGVTDAQITSARLLTQMLRENFGIVDDNCVTHEMVSVNPNKMLIGYHTDWAGRFPFEKVGLPDNYQLELPSIAAWGLTYDSQFVADMGGRVWEGARRAQESFRREARDLGLDVEKYRRHKQRQYSALLAKLRAVEPKSHAALLKEQ